MGRPSASSVHEVEEVAALLDQGAAGVAVEAVPVADLGQEREPVLADGDHVHPADHAGRHLVDQRGHGGMYRYSRPTQTTPPWSAAASTMRRQSATVVQSGFSTRMWTPAASTSSSTVGMRHVGTGHDHRVAQSGSEQVAGGRAKTAGRGAPVRVDSSTAPSGTPRAGSLTAVTTAPGSAARFRRCSSPINPTPMMPYRTVPVPGAVTMGAEGIGRARKPSARPRIRGGSESPPRPRSDLVWPEPGPAHR